MNKKLSDLTKDNENFASLKKDFEDRVKIGTCFDSVVNFLEAEKKRIETEYSKQSVKVYGAGIVAQIDFTQYLRFAFDKLDRGKDYLIEDILKSAEADYERVFGGYPEVIKHSFNSGEFEKGVLQNLSKGVGLLLFRKYLLDTFSNKEQKKGKPKTLKKIFVKPEHYKPCLNVLQEINVINANNEYIGNNKGVFPLWIRELETGGFIHKQSNIIYKNLLNKAITILNLSNDASEFTKTYKRLETNDTLNDIKYHLSQIKK